MDDNQLADYEEDVHENSGVDSLRTSLPRAAQAATHDVFISYSATDKPVADALCATLEARGVRCWIAPRDISPGATFAQSITDAIHMARVFVLVFSAASNSSPQVRREVDRAVSLGQPIVPFRTEDVRPSEHMEYYLAGQHWLDAMTPPLEAHLNRLSEAMLTLLRIDARLPTEVHQAQENRVHVPDVMEETSSRMDATQSDPLATSEVCATCGASLSPGVAFCGTCGTEISAIPNEAPQVLEPVVPAESESLTKLPQELAGFNWGAFFCGPIWGIFNNAWLTFLGFIIPFWFIVCGVKGNEWAWKGKKWDSPEHFRRVQRTWAIWGGVFFAVAVGLFLLFVVAAAGSGSSY